MDLSTLTKEIRRFSGIRRKGVVGKCIKEMDGAWGFGEVLLGPGDDAAVLKSGNGCYLLLAADGILPSLVKQDPRRDTESDSGPVPVCRENHVCSFLQVFNYPASAPLRSGRIIGVQPMSASFSAAC